MKKGLKTTILITACGLIAGLASLTGAAEPQLADYTAYPVFTVNPVKPNILIMLDNSGSMNFNAYGSYPGGGGVVRDQPYAGEPFHKSVVYTRAVAASRDDAEEGTSGSAWTGSIDLDLGRFDGGTAEAVDGLRFQNVEVPQGQTVIAAWIELTIARVPDGYPNDDQENRVIKLQIVGEASDDAPAFAATDQNISSRPETTHTVTWDSSVDTSGLGDWSPVNDTRNTPDLTSIVQEIVNRPGWEKGRAMVFKFRNLDATSVGKRDAFTYDGDSGKAPVLHIQYSLDKPVRYYGYFNPDWFYAWSSNKFVHRYKKVAYDDSSCPGSWHAIYPSSYSSPGEESTWNNTCLDNGDITSQGLWDGNWMNWASMRRIDIARKVIMGGLATSRQGSGSQVNYGEKPAQVSRWWYRYFDEGSGPAVTPYTGGNWFYFYNGYIYRAQPGSDPRWRIAIDKREVFDPEDFGSDHNLSGVLQAFGDKAWWGNEFFYTGTGNNREGGYISNRVGSNITNLITDLQNTGGTTWTPLSEAYYVAMQYFKQEKPQSGLGYHTGAIGAINNTNDPYYQDGEFIPCAKSFVILLTDGASTKDSRLPDSLKDYDGDGDSTGCNEYANSNCDYSYGGSDFLDDVALYARTQDLRSDLEGDQNLILYSIYAFGNDPDARGLLRDAARNGGFKDLNDNGLPDGDYTDPADQRKEWDEDGDGDPDTYFEAQDGYKLRDQLVAALNSILERASSGTAVSVLATSSEGEGNIMQAYFRPLIKTGSNEVKWAGYLQSMWVDSRGNMREDTNGNLALDVDQDLIIRYYSDIQGNTLVRKYSVDEIVCQSTDDHLEDAVACAGVPGTTEGTFNDGACVCAEDNYPEIVVTCSSTDPGQTDEQACDGVVGDSPGYYNDGDCFCDDGAIATGVELKDIHTIWEAGRQLALIDDPDDAAMGRKIFTSLDSAVGTTLYGGVEFSEANKDWLAPYFGVQDNSTWEYLGTSKNDRVVNLIRFIRGYDSGFEGTTSIRSRILAVDGTDRVWRLEDIVHSTPVTVSMPMDNYGLLYRDESYQEYFLTYKDRETVVYTGANDGMLHAFTSWRYDPDQKKFVRPDAAPDWEEIGRELWAYIPRSLLPHLKWLPRRDYTHVYYVDLKPRVVDLKIFSPDATHPGGWGTVLIGGLRMGGKSIPVTDDFDYDASTPDTSRDFVSSYFAIDVTDPRNPEVLWEKTYDGVNLTTSRPAVVKVQDTWYLVFGSGPEDYDGSSSGTGKIFVVNAATGVPYGDSNGNDWLFEPSEDEAFMGDAVGLDYGLNYNVDSVYIGQTYDDRLNATKPHDWKGSMYRIGIPWSCGSGCASQSYGTVDSFDTDGDGVDDCSCGYDTDPGNWRIGKLFESEAPITVSPSLSTDFDRNIWVYFGTGRYLSEADKSTTQQQWLFGVKDPFFNSKYDAENCSGSYRYEGTGGTCVDYFEVQTANLTLDSGDLFDADSFTVIYPWGYYEAPQGDCSSVPTGAVGDIYADGSCTCSYDWPQFQCSTADDTVADDATACSGVTCTELGNFINPSNGYEYSCTPYQVPLWGCIEKTTGGCDDAVEGVIEDTSDRQTMYWACTEYSDGGCDGVEFGYIVNDPANCVCDEVAPPAWSCSERPAGDCVAAGIEVGDEGDILGDGGSCMAGYWTCTDQVSGGCDNVDFTATTGFLGSNGDGDINGDGSCYCQFVDDPVAAILSTTSTAAMTFDEVVTEARTWEGWKRKLPAPGERSVKKPAIIGGLTLFTSYVPSDDTCAFGGESYLYALYFETGTANEKEVFNPGTLYDSLEETIVVKEKIKLGLGMASAPSIHVGLQKGNKAKVFLEQSTGVIKDIEVDPALNIRSGLQYWKQK